MDLLSTSQPRYSVLMATFNRGHLIRSAIQSVLGQTFGEFELVISNGGSTDNTADVVRSFSDPRIKYFECATRQSIGDNYQNAYDHASGKYITFLSDDDAFLPNMLERVDEIIRKEPVEMIVFRSCFYFQEPVNFQGSSLKANSIFLYDHDGELYCYPGIAAAKAVFANAQISDARLKKFSASFLANAVYHNDVFRRVAAKAPKLFEMTPADGFLAAATALVVKNYHYLDEPLHVWTKWADNASASPETKGKKFRDHYQKLLGNATLDFVPLSFALPMNLYCNAILRAKSLFDTMDQVDVDWKEYYLLNYRELMYARKFGLDVQHELKEFYSVLESEPHEIRAAVLAAIRQPRARIKQYVNLLAPRWTERVRRRLKTGPPVEGRALTGPPGSLDNVFDAAIFVFAEKNGQ